MSDLIEFLRIVNLPGALIVCVGLVVGGWVIVQCYGKR